MKKHFCFFIIVLVCGIVNANSINNESFNYLQDSLIQKVKYPQKLGQDLILLKSEKNSKWIKYTNCKNCSDKKAIHIMETKNTTSDCLFIDDQLENENIKNAYLIAGTKVKIDFNNNGVSTIKFNDNMLKSNIKAYGFSSVESLITIINELIQSIK